MTLPVVLAMAVGSPLAGRVLDKIGARVVVIAGTLLLTAGMLVLGLLGAQLWAFYVASTLIGLGLASLLGAPVRYIMLNEAPPEDRTAAQGSVTVFTGVGQLVSGALVGAVASSAGGGVSGYTLAYLVSGALCFLLLFLALGLRRQAPAGAPAAPATPVTR
jgi:MFS family permease